MVYIWDIIPNKVLENHSCPNNIECLFMKLMQVVSLRNVSFAVSKR